jgi:hypothetical protein
MTKAEAALLYASWGWHVLPVVPGGKAPANQHGVKDAPASRSARTVSHWSAVSLGIRTTPP